MMVKTAPKKRARSRPSLTMKRRMPTVIMTRRNLMMMSLRPQVGDQTEEKKKAAIGGMAKGTSYASANCICYLKIMGAGVEEGRRDVKRS